MSLKIVADVVQLSLDKSTFYERKLETIFEELKISITLNTLKDFITKARFISNYVDSFIDIPDCWFTAQKYDNYAVVQIYWKVDPKFFITMNLYRNDKNNEGKVREIQYNIDSINAMILTKAGVRLEMESLDNNTKIKFKKLLTDAGLINKDVIYMDTPFNRPKNLIYYIQQSYIYFDESKVKILSISYNNNSLFINGDIYLRKNITIAKSYTLCTLKGDFKNVYFKSKHLLSRYTYAENIYSPYSEGLIQYQLIVLDNELKLVIEGIWTYDNEIGNFIRLNNMEIFKKPMYIQKSIIFGESKVRFNLPTDIPFTIFRHDNDFVVTDYMKTSQGFSFDNVELKIIS
jgi:hypothetical protein